MGPSRFCAAVLALLVTACGGAADCDGAALGAALAAASPGDRVMMPACTVRESVVVPSGVTLVAQEGSALDVTEGNALSLVASSVVGVPTRVVGPLVVASSGIGVFVSGAGSAEVGDTSARITIEARGGIGLAVTTASVRAEGLDIRGDVEDDDACALASTTWGVGVDAGGDLELADVVVEGFGAGGVGAEGATLRALSAPAPLSVLASCGFGVLVYGGRAHLEGAQVSALYARGGGLTAGLGVGGGADVSSSALDIGGVEGTGIFHDGNSIGAHDAPFVHDIEGPGVWAQAMSSLTLEGALRIERVGLAGIVARAASSLTITGSGDAHVADVTRELLLTGPMGGVELGDGVHVSQTVPMDVRVDGLLVQRAQRVGLFFDGGGSAPASLSVASLGVEAPSGALGAVAQAAPGIASDWDALVTRTGVSADTDRMAPMLAVAPDVAGIVMPPTIVP